MTPKQVPVRKGADKKRKLLAVIEKNGTPNNQKEVAAAAKAAGCSEVYAYSVLKEMREGKPYRRPKLKPKMQIPATAVSAPSHKSDEPFAMSVELPKCGVLMRLTNGHGAIGTLLITTEGLCYTRPNAKRSTRERLPRLGWQSAGALFDSGLLDRP